MVTKELSFYGRAFTSLLSLVVTAGGWKLLIVFCCGQEKDMAAAPSEHECPVCHEDYAEPKILPCTHLVCRQCLITWLDKGGNGCCPLCRSPILTPATKGQGDFGSQVDALPTDLMTAAVIESQKALTGPSVCVCHDSTEATAFCLDCSVKLCDNCCVAHAKIPATRTHTLELLDVITAEKLAPCSRHCDMMAELYCLDHEEVICLLCESSSHRKCPDVGGIGEAAQTRREELKQQAETLKKKEMAVAAKMAELDQKMTNGKGKFKAMREEINTTFDDLQKHLDDRRHKLLAVVQQREEAYVLENTTSKTDLDKFRAKSYAHAGIMGRLVPAPDEILLGTLSKLKPRLDDLVSEKPCGCNKRKKKSAKVGSVSFDAKSLTELKKLLDDCGSISDQTRKEPGQNCSCPICGKREAVLDGPEMAAAIKVGHWVRRGRDWGTGGYGNEDGSPPGQGTVVSIKCGGHHPVQVQWDCGTLQRYRMGYMDKYDLQMA